MWLCFLPRRAPQVQGICHFLRRVVQNIFVERKQLAPFDSDWSKGFVHVASGQMQCTFIRADSFRGMPSGNPFPTLDFLCSCTRCSDVSCFDPLGCRTTLGNSWASERPAQGVLVYLASIRWAPCTVRKRLAASDVDRLNIVYLCLTAIYFFCRQDFLPQQAPHATCTRLAAFDGD